MLDKLFQMPKSAKKILAKSDGMWRGETHAGNAFDGADCLEQLNERAQARHVSRIHVDHRDSLSGPSSVTSFTPFAASARTSSTISSIERLRSDPRVCGTMQNAQCMLQPCMIETNAVAWRAVEMIADGRLGTGLFANIYDRQTLVIHALLASPPHKLIDVVRHTMKLLSADDQIDLH